MTRGSRVPGVITATCITLLTWCALSVRPDVARAADDSGNAIDIGDIPVEAKRDPDVEAAERSSSFVTVITPDERGAEEETVADVLSESVGVTVRRLGGLGSFATVSVRGSASNQVQVFVDGVPLNQAQAGSVDIGSIPLRNIERIEVYRGQTPAHLGAAGIGGAINIVTRQPKRTAHTRLGVTYGSFETIDAHASRGQRFDKWAYLASINVFRTTGDFHFVTDNGTPKNPDDDKIVDRINNEKITQDVLLKGSHYFTDTSHISLSNQFVHTDQGVPGIGVLQAEKTHFERAQNQAILSYGHTFSEGTLDLRGFHRYQLDQFVDPDGEVSFTPIDTFDQTHVFGGSAHGTWFATHILSLTGRAEYRRELFTPDTITGAGPRDEPTRTRDAVTLIANPSAEFGDERVHVTGLVRYDHIADDFGGAVPFGVAVIAPDRTATHELVSYSGGVRVRIVSRLFLKANAGKFFRVPTFVELFGNEGTIIGNTDLLPEESLNFDAGFSYDLPEPLMWGDTALLGAFHFEYAFFLNDVENIIVFLQNSQRTSFPENISSAEIRGHEIAWAAEFLEHIEINGNYTLLDATDTSGVTFLDGNQLPGRPREEGHVRVALFETHGRLFYELDFIAGNFLDRANFDLIDERVLHSAGATLTPPERPGLSVTFEGKNLSDNRVSDFAGFPLPGRSFFATAEYAF